MIGLPSRFQLFPGSVMLEHILNICEADGTYDNVYLLVLIHEHLNYLHFNVLVIKINKIVINQNISN